MGITLVIVGGLVIITLAAVGFDYLGKRKGKPDKELDRRVGRLETKLVELESAVKERDERIGKLEGDLGFVNRLLEDKSR